MDLNLKKCTFKQTQFNKTKAAEQENKYLPVAPSSEPV